MGLKTSRQKVEKASVDELVFAAVHNKYGYSMKFDVKLLNTGRQKLDRKKEEFIS
jgi:hypothetical protein